VQILREAKQGIEPYFKGVGAKGPSMADLKDVFAKSATAVYARALELAEIVGVSHSFDRFIRAIYENSDRVPETKATPALAMMAPARSVLFGLMAQRRARSG
jgi:hypothetical protein